jgi:undecaprenyl-diphosphatase
MRRDRSSPWWVALLSFFAFAVIEIGVITHLTDGVDSTILTFAESHRTEFLTTWMLLASQIGAGEIAIPIALLLGGILWWRQGRPSALLYVGGSLSGWAFQTLLKVAFRRPRPHLIPKLGAGGWYSFPSGHAMLAVLVFGLAAVLLSRTLSAPARLATVGTAVLVVVSIAVSRVYLGVHFPTDVLAGLFGGAGWASLCLRYGDHLTPRTKLRARERVP